MNIIKKHFPVFILLGLILIVIIFARINTLYPPERDKSYIVNQSDGTTKYILSEKVCNFFYSTTPSICLLTFPKDQDIGRTYRSISVDNHGRLELIMDENDIESWRALLNSTTKEILLEAENDSKHKIEVLPNNKGLVYYSSSEGAGWGFLRLIQLIYIIGEFQMFDGIDPDEISVDVTLKNINTENIVWHGYVPGDVFNIAPEDWDV